MKGKQHRLPPPRITYHYRETFAMLLHPFVLLVRGPAEPRHHHRRHRAARRFLPPRREVSWDALCLAILVTVAAFGIAFGLYEILQETSEIWRWW